MIFDKRYLQFNNLVFDGYDMIRQSDETITHKLSSTAYSYGHGSYMPFKDSCLYIQEGSVSMTLELWLKKVPCDMREFYARFAEQELSRSGRLWAIKNNEIIWAWAAVKSIHQLHNYEPDKVEWDVEFTIPEGVWHKADKQRTFVLPYDPCLLMDCKGFQKYDPCVSSLGGGCCEACQENKWWQDMADRCFCCCVDEITADMALCYHTRELQAFYGCETPFQLAYSCSHAEKFNTNPYIGQKICAEDICDSNIIAGRFYSDSDLETNNITIAIVGKVQNPTIEVNGNMNIIKGEYNGELVIEPSGDVLYRPKDNECCDLELLDPSVWEIPSGNTYGWTVRPQTNSIIINANACCGGGSLCVYIDHDPITI